MFKWIKKQATTFVKYIQPTLTPRNYHRLSQEGYERNVIVYRCVHMLAKSIASVPLLVYEGDQEAITHEILDLFRNPNEEMTYHSFIHHLVSYFMLSGNVYILYKDKKLYLLHPNRVTIEKDGFVYNLGLHKIRYTSEEILHIKQFHPRDDWYGFSPLMAAASAIDQHNAVGLHNLSLLQNGGRPSGALMMEETLSEHQRKTIRKNLEDLYQGNMNAGKIMLLEGNFKWQELGLSPKDCDFLPGKIMAAQEIATAFGISPILVGLTQDASYNNYREARLQLWEDTVLPLLDYILAHLNTFFLHQNIRLAYDSDAIPALSAKREDVWKKLNTCDFLTVNEKRQAIGYGPIEGGDVLVKI